MRIQLALLLLSGVLVYGCVQQSEDFQTPRRSQFVTTALPSTEPLHEASTTAPAPKPRVHIVKLEGYCPPDLLVEGEDFVKFINLSKDSVVIDGLDNPGIGVTDTTKKGGRLAKEKARISIRRTVGKRAQSGAFEVNVNPFKNQALIFRYQVMYDGIPCADDPMTGQDFWSVPPGMIVGPDTL